MYLIWTRTMIGFAAAKVPELLTNPAGKVMDYVTKHKLTEEEWLLSLNELIKAYPPPTED